MMHRLNLTLVSCAVGILFAALGSVALAAAPPVPKGIMHRQVTYKTIGDVTLKMDVFEPEKKDPQQKYPAIVFFHGGGWNDGAPSQLFPQAQYLASRGMIAFSAEYRVNKVHHTSPVECVKDAKSAIRWVRANAATLGVDPDRIASGGSSAGGHMAAALATVSYTEAGESDKVSCVPNALVLLNPVIDNGPEGYGYERVKRIFPAISPLHNLKPGLPPTIFLVGDKDKYVPKASAEKYRDTMKGNGDRCELFLYAGQPHTFYSYGNAHHRYYYQSLNEIDKFLASLGYLEGPARITQEQMDGKAE